MVYQNYRRHDSGDRIPTLPKHIPAYFPTQKFQTFFPTFPSLNNAFFSKKLSLSLRRCYRVKFKAIAPKVSLVLRYCERYFLFYSLSILSVSLWWTASFSGLAAMPHLPILPAISPVLFGGFVLLVGLGFLAHLGCKIRKQLLALRRAQTEIAELKQCLQTLCYLDDLTGIANRRLLNQTIEKEWSKALQTGRSIAVVFIDIDHFKQYNDCYGHQQGDHCLRLIAQTIDRVTQHPQQLAARYGGEEFMLLLPDTTATQAQAIAQQVLRDIQALQISHLQSTTSDIVTASAGICAMVPSPTCQLNYLIKKADQALYQAKQNGRNQAQILDIQTADSLALTLISA